MDRFKPKTTQYLQGVTGNTAAGRPCLPSRPVAAFAAATATSRLIRRTSNARMSARMSAGCAAMLVGVAWMSRVSLDTTYLTGIALP
jgi:hypothetical protein